MSAVFEAGFDQYDSKLVYTDLYEAQAFYEYGDSVTGLEMKVQDIGRAEEIAKRFDVLLNKFGIYYTMDWHQLNDGLFTALLLQQISMSIVLGLIILVAACTVIANHHHGGARRRRRRSPSSRLLGASAEGQSSLSSSTREAPSASREPSWEWAWDVQKRAGR